METSKAFRGGLRAFQNGQTGRDSALKDPPNREQACRVLVKSRLGFGEQEARGLGLPWVERFPHRPLHLSPHKVNSEASGARGARVVGGGRV